MHASKNVLTKVRIISLGEIVTPNFENTFKAFMYTIMQKDLALKPHDIIPKLKQALAVLMQEDEHGNSILNDFKVGKITEQLFINKAIAAVKTNLGVELLGEEFKAAWRAGCPTYANFKDRLAAAIMFNAEPQQKMVLISFTNPIDMEHLREELEKNALSFNIDPETGSLTKIGGMDLYLTYETKKSKAQLITEVIQNLGASKVEPTSATTFAEVSMVSTATPEILYIKGVNQIEDLALAQDFATTSAAVESAADVCSVKTIIWEHSKQPLEDLLNSEAKVYHLEPAKL